MSYGTSFAEIARSLPVKTTEPTAEPVSASEAAAHCHVDAHDDDGTFSGLIKAAREMVELDARLALMTQTHTLYLDCFPAWAIELRTHPVVSITSVTYLNSTGVSTVLSSALYRLNENSKPAILTPAYGQTWPTTYPVAEAVEIAFVCGYTSAANVPEIAKLAMKLLIGHWFRNRESVGTVGEEISYSYEALLRRLRWAGEV